MHPTAAAPMMGLVAHPELQRRTTVDVLAAALRERILDGELTPGARLVEREIVDRYEVARATVRAALRALQTEGLVRIETHRGARVAQLGPGELHELFELRTALELEAAHLALTRNDGALPAPVHEAVDRLVAACRAQRPRWRTIAAAHAGVHEAIVAAGGSRRIEASYRQLSAEMQLFVAALRPVWSADRMAAHHVTLLQELEREGTPALRRHLDEGLAEVLGGGAT
jgi:DNA-binding GntR family transcriptional regulator